MKSVYIFGPIHQFGKSYLPVYKKLTKLCTKYFDKIIGTYPDFWNSKETGKRFYRRTYNTITKCNLFIAEISSPSIGVGMELQMAQEFKIPVIALCKETVSPSIMATGIPCVKNVIYYSSLKDLTDKLDNYLKQKHENRD